MKALWLKLILLFGPLISLAFIAFQTSDSLTLSSQNDVYISPYSDTSGSTSPAARSTVDSCNVSNDHISLVYTLRKGYEYPYAGVCLNPMGKEWDFTGFEYLELYLHSHNLKTIRISLQGSVDGIEVTKEYEQPIDKEMRRYRIPLSSFQVPSWWYSEQEIRPDSVALSAFWGAVKGISFENPSIFTLDNPSSVNIKSVKVKTGSGWALWCGALWFGVMLLLEGVIKYKNRKPHTGFTYEQVVLDKPEEILFAKVEEYVGLNFTETDLAIADVARQVGATSKRLAALFRDKYSCTFKQYLNQIRLKEAYRLVTEEKHSISQILLAVGFNSTSYFNRLFAKEFNISPTELRKQVKK